MRLSHLSSALETHGGKKILIRVKKRHTLKTMAMTTKNQVIKYLSAIYVGTSHDFLILKTEFPPSQGWFNKFNIKVDFGYLGIAKAYQDRTVSIPHKKPKNQPLTSICKV